MSRSVHPAQLPHTLLVLIDGQQIGHLTRTSRGMRLLYDATGRTAPRLSLSMPPTQRRHDATPWVQALLPDNQAIKLAWRRRFGIAHSTDDFDLLRHVGEDLPGAVQLVRPERLDTVLTNTGRVTPISTERVGEQLREATLRHPSAAHGTGRFSLAGMQPKIALQRTPDGDWGIPEGPHPSTHILKPAMAGWHDQDLVEHVTTRAAAHLGLRVPDTSVQTFGDTRALVVTRYDRHWRDGRWRRLHQEDLCQALGLTPERKYEADGGPGPAQIAALIRQHSHHPDADTKHFARALIYAWASHGTDAHARNYSMLVGATGARLAPCYDLNSMLAYARSGDTMSMRIGTTARFDSVTTRDWDTLARQLDLEPAWIRDETDRQRALLPHAIATARDELGELGDSPSLERLHENTTTRAGALTRTTAATEPSSEGDLIECGAPTTHGHPCRVHTRAGICPHHG